MRYKEFILMLILLLSFSFTFTACPGGGEEGGRGYLDDDSSDDDQGFDDDMILDDDVTDDDVADDDTGDDDTTDDDMTDDDVIDDDVIDDDVIDDDVIDDDVVDDDVIDDDVVDDDVVDDDSAGCIDCSNPIVINLPADMPYFAEEESTCGTCNDYDFTCMWPHDVGADVIYQLNVTDNVQVDIVLDPGTTIETGLGIDDSCPLDSTCIETSSSGVADPHGFDELVLAPGTYYLMVDSWDPPFCIPDYNLSISGVATDDDVVDDDVVDDDVVDDDVVDDDVVDDDVVDDDVIDDDVVDDDVVDDDVVDDDVVDDDVVDDDVVDDDTFVGSAPILSNGYWDPDPMVLADLGMGELQWSSNLYGSVCDVDNDLLPDGQVFIYVAGTGTLFFGGPIDWSFFHDPPTVDLTQVSNCAEPVEFGSIVPFGPASAPPPPGEYCIDAEATDSAGNFSNKLENICVTMAGGDDDTVDDDTVDDDTVDDDTVDDDTVDDDTVDDDTVDDDVVDDDVVDDDVVDDDVVDDDVVDDDVVDDDTIDDDTIDDDTIDDDIVDDDTSVGDPPILSNGYWDPDPMVLADIGMGELQWSSNLYGSVCDVDNDLLPDGQVFIYVAGTGTLFFGGPLDWSFFHDPPTVDLTQVSNCAEPVEFGSIVPFGPASAPPPPGEYCIDAEATDSAGNFSNKLENICVTMAGGDDDTVDDDTVDDDTADDDTVDDDTVDDDTVDDDTADDDTVDDDTVDDDTVDDDTIDDDTIDDDTASPCVDCNNPIVVSIPSSLPYFDNGQTTCEACDDYNSTCLGSFDGGEDVVYELQLASPQSIQVVMDPKGTAWTGLGLDNSCPLDGDCLVIDTDGSGNGNPLSTGCVALEAGNYYVMVDTFPSPTCIPDFDLSIFSCGADDDTVDDDTVDDDTIDDDTIDDDTIDDDTIDDDTIDDDTADDDTVEVFLEDFEDDTPGMYPGAPWSLVLQTGTSEHVITTPKDSYDGSGNWLWQLGDPGGAVYSNYTFGPLSNSMWLLFDFYPAAGSAFSLMVDSWNPAGFAQTEFWLDLQPDGTLYAYDHGSAMTVPCAPVNYDAQNNIVLQMNIATRLYSVKINGSSTACTNIQMMYAIPSDFYQFGVLDKPDPGWGGNVLFDNFQGFAINP